VKARSVVEIVVITVGVVALLAAALIGSSFLVPVATAYEYDPGDGVGGEVGALDIEGAVVITEDGELGNLIFSVVNLSQDDETLVVQYEGDGGKQSLEVEVPAGERVGVGFGDAGQLLLEGIATPAGALLPIYFQYGSETGVQLPVPVLNGEFAEYSELTPTPMPTPTPEPTATATPEPAEG